jgi:uncharacterized protein (TIGR02265 family)
MEQDNLMLLTEKKSSLLIAGKLIKGQSIQALLEATGATNHPEILRIVATEFDFHYYDSPLTYPFAKFLLLAEYLAKQFFPDLELTEALEEIGYRTALYSSKIAGGGVLRTLAGVLGPYKGAPILVKAMTNRMPWSRQEIEEIRPHYIRYRIRDVPGTGFVLRGILRAGVEFTGGKVKKITTTHLAEEDIMHEIELY